MAEQKLLVKREGDFHYPIYFKNDFQDLAGAIREEGLENRKICIVTDSHVAPLYHEALNQLFRKFPLKYSLLYLKLVKRTKPEYSTGII